MTHTYSQHELDTHLKEHHESTFSEYLREIVYGGVDGIITTFAVVAGFAGAQTGENAASCGLLTVLLFGLANLFADGASMGLGSFLSVRAQKFVYKNEEKKERYEVAHHLDQERQRTVFLLQKEGFSLEEAKKLTDIYETNPAFWVDFMMQYELRLSNPNHGDALYSALFTFSSFVVFGFIPLVSYLFLKDMTLAFYCSGFLTLTALTVLGLVNGYVSKRKMSRAVAETLLVGVTAAVIAFGVGSLF